MRSLSRKGTHAESGLARLGGTPWHEAIIARWTVSFAEVLTDPAQLERRFSEIARLVFGEP